MSLIAETLEYTEKAKLFYEYDKEQSVSSLAVRLLLYTFISRWAFEPVICSLSVHMTALHQATLFHCPPLWIWTLLTTKRQGIRTHDLSIES